VTTPPIETDLATAILAVYRAPLEDFISRRDALAKQLRAEKRRDDATLVKALRKPSRIAWTLDGVVHEDPGSIEHLAAAIGAAQTGADLRTALETVKDAVRAVAAAGARVAVRAGFPIEPNALAAAVHAIIGDASAFAEFRAARLVEVPQGGGLDLLIALTASPSSPSRQPTPVSRSAAPPAPAIEAPKPDPRIALAASARAELRRAETVLAEMREQSNHAAKALRDAETKLDAAEHALLHAQSERDARRDDVERTRRHAESAAANADDARRAFDDAETRVAEFE
jgi:septal ring factor EnvC (AmiA/AmiB activator)